ncbi:hypothetical protein PSTT_10763 [Puccinia striiformis]|uniref:Uncharacterized protein n=1 Tax=Puccinia striiformis TaxID=27350 RepID=A0A2S4V331_9BASI|nr:hypothetical protein PSTT_10763 [Puccinia striiformis]
MYQKERFEWTSKDGLREERTVMTFNVVVWIELGAWLIEKLNSLIQDYLHRQYHATTEHQTALELASPSEYEERRSGSSSKTSKKNKKNNISSSKTKNKNNKNIKNSRNRLNQHQQLKNKLDYQHHHPHQRVQIIEQQAIQLTTNNNHSLTGLSTGHHLIYLLSRSRAIQAWKDLVGFDLPARPGSLRFIFGNQAVWAAEKPTGYDLIHRFWKGSVHLNHPNFTLLSPTFPPQQSPSSTHEPSSPPRQEKRVFKFSKSTLRLELYRVSPQTHHHLNKSQEDDHSQDEERSDLITTTSTTTATTTNDEFRSSYKRTPRFRETLVYHQVRLTHHLSLTQPISLPLHLLLPQLLQVSEGSSSNNKLHPPSIQRPSSRSSSSSTLASSSVDSTMSNNRRSSITQSAVQSMGKTSSATGATKTQEPAPYTFKARPVPASVTEPIGALSPKMSKAAMLRLGLAWTPPVRSIPSTNSTLSSSTSTVVTPTRYAPVASLNPPTVQPRHTKASALQNQSQIFENTPGHKRTNLHTNIPSARSKTVPRHTKASALRTGGSALLESLSTSSSTTNTSGPNPLKISAGRKSGDFYHGVPGHKRTEKISVEATKRPEIEPRMTKTSLLRMGVPSAPTTSSTTTKPGPKPDNSKGGHISRPSVDSGDSHTSVNHEDQASVDYSSEIETEIDTEIEVDHPGHAVTLPIDLSCSVRSSSATKGSSLIPTTTSSASNHSSNHSSRIPHNQRFGSAIIRK